MFDIYHLVSGSALTSSPAPPCSLSCSHAALWFFLEHNRDAPNREPWHCSLCPLCPQTPFTLSLITVVFPTHVQHLTHPTPRVLHYSLGIIFFFTECMTTWVCFVYCFSPTTSSVTSSWINEWNKFRHASDNLRWPVYPMYLVFFLIM